MPNSRMLCAPWALSTTVGRAAGSVLFTSTVTWLPGGIVPLRSACCCSICATASSVLSLVVSRDTSTARPVLLLLLSLGLLLLSLSAGLLAGEVGAELPAGSAAPVPLVCAFGKMLSGTNMTDFGAWVLLSD